jgi:hypothetical protein
VGRQPAHGGNQAGPELAPVLLIGEDGARQSSLFMLAAGVYPGDVGEPCSAETLPPTSPETPESGSGNSKLFGTGVRRAHCRAG